MPDCGTVTDDLGGMRRRYLLGRLLEEDMAPEPVAQFRAWLAEAVAAGLPEPNAMVLSTADQDAWPASRIVLLKELDARGFVFYTNLRSRKARDLRGNPAASLCFPWIAMERQVTANGMVEALRRDEVAAYWRTRPRESQLGAWASDQSAPIGSRAELEARAEKVARRFPGEIPLPDHWGGFRVVPDAVEFWQGGPGRLHDLLRYARTPGSKGAPAVWLAGAPGVWRLSRLCP